MEECPRPLLATVGGKWRIKKVDQASTGRISMDLLRIVVAMLLPPLGVFLQVGISKHFWINVLLTVLGFVPGIIHAIWVINRY